VSFRVYVYHAGGFACPVIGVVLADTEAINPEIVQTEMAGDSDCVKKCLREV
jgi:hypothetical protein